MLYINDKFLSPDYLINASIIFIPIFIVVFIIRIKKALQKHAFSFVKEFIIFSFLFYLYNVFELTLFPIFWFADRSILPAYGQSLFFETQPLLLFSNFNHYTLYNILGNVLLLLPIGFYLGLFFKNRSIWKITTIVFFISLTIEFLQLVMAFFYLGNRIFDITDLVLNTIGGFIGCFLYISPIGKWVKQAEEIQTSFSTD